MLKQQTMYEKLCFINFEPGQIFHIYILYCCTLLFYAFVSYALKQISEDMDCTKTLKHLFKVTRRIV